MGSLRAIRGLGRIEAGGTLAAPQGGASWCTWSRSRGPHRPVLPDVDERAARRTLRAQIARLERDLAAAVIAAYPRLPAGTASVRAPGPRLLGLDELERIRDDLADRIADVRAQAARQGERQAASAS